MPKGQNAFRIRSLNGENRYQISNVHRGINPATEQPQYCDKCEVRQLCQIEGDPPINRIISLTDALIARCQRALQRAKGMIVPVTDQNFPPSIISQNIDIPCLQDSAKDPYPYVKGDNGDYWWYHK